MAAISSRIGVGSVVCEDDSAATVNVAADVLPETRALLESMMDALCVRMRSPNSRRMVDALFQASPRELGSAIGTQTHKHAR
jgi:hypothetical protein